MFSEEKDKENESAEVQPENKVAESNAENISEAADGAENSSSAESTDASDKVQKEVLVAELVKKHPELVEPLMMMGMHCISCFASQMETLEEAAMVHGLNPDEVVEDLNQFLADEKSGRADTASESMFC